MKWDRNEIGKFLASIGAALLIAGYLRYSIQSELQLMSKILLIAGGVILLAGAGIGYEGILAFFSKRSSKLGTNTTVLSLGVIVILAIVNVLGYQHHKRFDLTTQKLFTLSDQTKKVVGGLKTDVSIVRFSKTPDSRFDDLMAEYRNLNAARQVSEHRSAGKARSRQGIWRHAHWRRHSCLRPAQANAFAQPHRTRLGNRCHQRAS